MLLSILRTTTLLSLQITVLERAVELWRRQTVQDEDCNNDKSRPFQTVPHSPHGAKMGRRRIAIGFLLVGRQKYEARRPAHVLEAVTVSVDL